MKDQHSSQPVPAISPIRFQGRQRGFTLIELMVVIVIIGILVAIALPNFIGAQDRAKLASVKSNMHTFQTLLETYAVDWGGVYPNSYASIQTEAIGRGYSKDYVNPLTGQTASLQNDVDCRRLAEVITGTFAPNSTTDQGVYGGPGGATCQGQVIYRRAVQGGTAYGIYGLDKSGAWIHDKGHVFTLSNS